MRQAKIIFRTILFMATVCLFFGATAIDNRASAQVYCPFGYYFVPNYGCAPTAYLYGYPYYYGYPYGYGYPYYGFGFFYGGRWGGPYWGGRGFHGAPHGGWSAGRHGR